MIGASTKRSLLQSELWPGQGEAPGHGGVRRGAVELVQVQRVVDEPHAANGESGSLIAGRLMSPVGVLGAEVGARGVKKLWFEDSGEATADEPASGASACDTGDSGVACYGDGDGAMGVLRRLEEELRAYFIGSLRVFSVPLDLRGTVFQRAVWDELLRIPYGETRSYEEVACALGRRGAQRAVGKANGDNPVAILVPCHRVILKSGELRGYGGGLWRKEVLLKLEACGGK